MKQAVYGKQTATETPAGGVTGVLCRSIDNTYFFRIYHEVKTFTDYDLRHADMAITIAADEMASFYTMKNGNKALDHSSEGRSQL